MFFFCFQHRKYLSNVIIQTYSNSREYPIYPNLRHVLMFLLSRHLKLYFCTIMFTYYLIDFFVQNTCRLCKIKRSHDNGCPRCQHTYRYMWNYTMYYTTTYAFKWIWRTDTNLKRGSPVPPINNIPLKERPHLIYISLP